MTEQLKAEAYVRSQRPALREKYMSHSAPDVVEVIPLQDWLAVLEKLYTVENKVRNSKHASR